MAHVNFKPVCECGYIFKKFMYTPISSETLIDGEREFVGIRYHDECFHGLRCPNCGEYITGFVMPRPNKDGELIYEEE